MPRRRRFRRKRFRRRRRKKRGYANFNKPLLGNRLPVKLRYSSSQDVAINPTALGVGVHVFSCNGLYDPDITGSGHQPRGWDQMIVLYDHGYCVGSKITVSFGVDTVSEDFIGGIAIKDSSTVSTNINNYMESRNVKSGIHSYNSGPALVITKKFSTKKFHSQTSIVGNDRFISGVANNPSEQSYYHIFAGPLGNNDIGIINVSVVIDYLVVFCEPTNPAGS